MQVKEHNTTLWICYKMCKTVFSIFFARWNKNLDQSNYILFIHYFLHQILANRGPVSSSRWDSKEMPLGQVIQAQDETRIDEADNSKSIPKKASTRRGTNIRRVGIQNLPRWIAVFGLYLPSLFTPNPQCTTLRSLVQPLCACQNVLYIQTDRYYTQQSRCRQGSTKSQGKFEKKMKIQMTS